MVESSGRSKSCEGGAFGNESSGSEACGTNLFESPLGGLLIIDAGRRVRLSRMLYLSVMSF